VEELFKLQMVFDIHVNILFYFKIPETTEKEIKLNLNLERYPSIVYGFHFDDLMDSYIIESDNETSDSESENDQQENIKKIKYIERPVKYVGVRVDILSHKDIYDEQMPMEILMYITKNLSIALNTLKIRVCTKLD